MANYKDCFYYFVDKFKEQTGNPYFYYKNRLGLELVKIKRLGLDVNGFKAFIDWLYDKNKLASINFLGGQLNDYFSSQEYNNYKVIQETLLHEKIMAIRRQIIDRCQLCNKTGYLNGNVKCKCMDKFLKIRKKMRGENK